MSKMMKRPVLVLNAYYEPISITPAQNAMKLLVKGVADITETDPSERFVHINFKLPSVVRLAQYKRIPYRHVMPHRHNIILRDGNTCQYCYQVFPSIQLTMDHVIPRAHGGRSTWENLVAACQPCNGLKADRTPEQAGMELLRIPRMLSIHTSRHMLRMLGSTDPNWRKYLYH
jgi:5-methylcytosine-specific restriction endonuclease McrA